MESSRLGIELLKVLGFLGLLIVASILVVRAKRRQGRQPGYGARLRIIESVSLGGNKYLCLVRAGRSYILLGVTDQNVRAIKELSEDDLSVDQRSEPGESPCAKRVGSEDKGRFFQVLAEEIKKAKDRLSTRGLVLMLCFGLCFVSVFLARAGICHAAPSPVPIPEVSVNIDGQTAKGGLGTALGILGLLTVLSLAPAILILTTSFTRIVIVFSFLRSGLGTQQAPPNQVLIGLALILTFFIMAPTWNVAYQAAIAPYIDGALSSQEAIAQASVPLKEFMLKQTREKDLALFATMNGSEAPASPEEMSLLEVTPAFCISELRTAFEMGFMLYLPFLVVDMVVASTLMSMGMLMLPPVLISLPFKLLLFILVDGWGLITKSLIGSFR